MTPYNHYPKVGLNYCRCKHCGNTLRSIMISRIIDKRYKSKRRRIIPEYKTRHRQSRFYLPYIKVKRRVPPPPYKQRREFDMYIKNFLSQFGDDDERTN